jgi:hypothetical protein
MKNQYTEYIFKVHFNLLKEFTVNEGTQNVVVAVVVVFQCHHMSVTDCMVSLPAVAEV